MAESSGSVPPWLRDALSRMFPGMFTQQPVYEEHGPTPSEIESESERRKYLDAPDPVKRIYSAAQGKLTVDQARAAWEESERTRQRTETKEDADTQAKRSQGELAGAQAALITKQLEGALSDRERIELEEKSKQLIEKIQQEGRVALEAFRQTFEREIRVWDAAQRAAEAKGQRDWQSIENEKDRLARASESDKSIAAQERISDKRMAFDAEQGAANRSVTARGQDLQAMAGKDSWVLGLIKAQVDSGQLSLDQATKKFSAYIERAKLPTQIMENISNAMQPFVPYMTNRQAGEFAPGFEPGGPMEKLVQASGATYDPSKYAVNPVKVDLFGLAKKAGADFSQSGKLPDPDKMFNVKVPSIDPNMRSNLDAFMERESAGNESADGGGGVLASLTARPEPSMVSPDEKADLERYVSNLR